MLPWSCCVFQQNPFLKRLCAIFSTATDGTYSLSFDDFVDMMNVLSDQAPFSLKANYAFLLFGTHIRITFARIFAEFCSKQDA